MAEIKIEDPRIKIVDNGFIVEYRECEKKADSTYDGYSSTYKELVFSLKDQNKALAKFIELGKAAGKLSATSANEESPEGEE